MEFIMNRFFKLSLICVIASLISFTTLISADIKQFIPDREDMPVEVVDHTLYSVFFDDDLKMPLFVIGELNSTTYSGGISRAGYSFRPDPKVPASVKSSAWNNTGHHRGHLWAADDSNSSALTLYESFYTSNCIMQDPILNEGDWKELEMLLHKLSKNEKIVVISGSIITSSPVVRINGVAVPDSIFKVVYFVDRKTISSYLFPNRAPTSKKTPSDYQVSLAEIEQLTSFTFKRHAEGIDFIEDSPAKANRTIVNGLLITSRAIPDDFGNPSIDIRSGCILHLNMSRSILPYSTSPLLEDLNSPNAMSR